MAPLLRAISPFCPHLRHRQVVPTRSLAEWWTVWGVWWGWTNPMRRAAWRTPLSYGQRVDLWMLASGGQWGLWVLHPESLTQEQWNLQVEDDLGGDKQYSSTSLLIACLQGKSKGENKICARTWWFCSAGAPQGCGLCTIHGDQIRVTADQFIISLELFYMR